MMTVSKTADRRPQILVVDDEVAMVRLLELLLKPLGDVTKAYSVPEAIEYRHKGMKFDCVITDVSMPEASGISLLELLRKESPDIPVIVMTAFSSVPQAVEAIQKGAFEYIVKPFENNDLVRTIQRAIQKRGLSLGETKSMPTGWICNSSSMKDFVLKLEKAAHATSSLLLIGEAGTGKGRAARWVHERSEVAKKRDFISIDGRAHEEDAILSEQQVNRAGTLFVAEVFSLSARLQDRIFDLLHQEKVRVIASTSSAPTYQAHPNFREDLFQLLARVSIKIPSLRERKEDLEALAGEILQNLALKLKIPSLQLHPEGMKRLYDYDFPGNVRELEQLLQRASLESRGGMINGEDLKFDQMELRSQLPFAIPVEDGWNRLDLLKENLERELILRALDRFPNLSNTQIAQVLGTTRRILELRMKQYKIRESSE